MVCTLSTGFVLRKCEREKRYVIGSPRVAAVRNASKTWFSDLTNASKRTRFSDSTNANKSTGFSDPAPHNEQEFFASTAVIYVFLLNIQIVLLL